MTTWKAILASLTIAALGCAAGLGADPPAASTRLPAPPGSNFLTHDAALDEGWTHAVIEVPAGSDQKWETTKDGTAIEWERLASGELRVIQYLPYPFNYGMVPRTLLPRQEGGDGDPLDVVVLGPALERGSIVPVRVLGVFVMTDRGERDDKLIAVTAEGAFAGLRELTELDQRFPGSTSIIATWFTSYKGGRVVRAEGIRNSAAAAELLEQASAAYESHAGAR